MTVFCSAFRLIFGYIHNVIHDLVTILTEYLLLYASTLPRHKSGLIENNSCDVIALFSSSLCLLFGNISYLIFQTWPIRYLAIIFMQGLRASRRAVIHVLWMDYIWNRAAFCCHSNPDQVRCIFISGFRCVIFSFNLLLGWISYIRAI
jgi:hypothetical protein